MRRIEIFVSSPGDVQNERSLADRLIRSIAAEFNVPVSVSYSNRLRALRSEDTVLAEQINGRGDDALLLCPCFWEYQDSRVENSDREHIPNTGQYDLVVCILWSRLGTKLAPPFVMPDGAEPRSATDYEIAWALDQAKLTPGFPALHVYRNRSLPAAPLEPKQDRERFLKQWDLVQEFFADWEKESAFSEACTDYRDLEDFEDLFRKHFREFLTKALEDEFFARKLPKARQRWKSNPFRGLSPFDFEHAPIFHGRTKAIGEVLDALKRQATAKKPFVLLLGSSGSGKSSLVRAGVLPILAQVGTADGDGPWRRAVTQPAAGGPGGDPFDALAAALLDLSALPELPHSSVPNGCKKLAFELRNHPDQAAVQVSETLDHLSLQELDHLLDEQEKGLPFEGRREAVELAQQKRLFSVRPKAQLALVVDQLEELFAGEFSRELQRRYIATLVALVRSQRVFVIATLRNDFYGSYQEFPELVEFVGSSGKIDLRPPKRQDLANLIQLPAEAAGLRFEKDTAAGRSLDEALLESAIASVEPLPLLEHLLSRLYEKQDARKDGLLRWSDFRQMGELECALANHAESVFSTLRSEEQAAFGSIMRQLVAHDRGPKSIGLPVAYRNLVASPDLNERQKAVVKSLVDRLIREGLLCSSFDPGKEQLVSVSHEVLFRRWPRLSQLTSEDGEVSRERNRLDKRLKLWLGQGQRDGDLLEPATGLAEAESLLRHFHSSLNEAQIEFVQKSLVKQNRRRRLRNSARFMAVGSFVALAAVTAQWWATDSGRKKADAGPALNQSGALEPEFKQAEGRAQFAENKTDLAVSQMSVLEAQLKKADERAQLAEKNIDLAISQRNALEIELQKAEERTQLAEKSALLVTDQRKALENALQSAQEKAQTAQTNANLGTSQRSALEAELKKAQETAEAAQKNVDLATSQRGSLEAELKKTQETAQTAQKSADLATSQRGSLEAELKKAQETAQAAQKSADLATSQRSTLEAELKKTQETAEAAQKNADLATSQRGSLEAELKKAQETAQTAQKSADLATSQRSALEAELKKAQEIAEAAQKNADLATSQRGSLEAELKKAQETAQTAQNSADLATSQRSALEAELKKAKETAEAAQKNADLATSQRSTLEAELEKAKREAQLVQKIADLVAAQPHLADSRLSTEKLAQRNADQHPDQSKSEQAPASDAVGANLVSAASPTPNGEPPVPVPASEKPVGVDQNEAVIQPANALLPVSVKATATDVKSDPGAPDLSQEPSVKNFVSDYMATVAGDDVSTQERFFARRVNFYGEGILSLPKIQASTERYHREWPVRKWQPQGEPEILHSANSTLYEVLQPFAWTVSNGDKQVQGNATLYLRIRRNSQGELHIVHVEQRNP